MENIIDSNGFDANHQTFSFHMLEKQEKWGRELANARFAPGVLLALLQLRKAAIITFK